MCQCEHCHNEINAKEKKVLLWKYGEIEGWVHDGACFENYKDEKSNQGAILGICEVCAKPVKIKQDYDFALRDNSGEVGGLFETVLPSGHILCISHKDCLEKVNTF